jgi:hypothetical protein
MAAAIFLTVACLVFPGLAQGAGTTAELRGDVTDPTGAVIPGAKVVLTDLAKGTSRVVTTDANGQYVVIGLLPSQYEVKVEATGFTATREETIYTLLG